jgi:thymidine kinase
LFFSLTSTGQFYDGISTFVRVLTRDYDKLVIVAGLNLTFEAKPFHNMKELIYESDAHEFIFADCHVCKAKCSASYTMRKVQRSEEFLIGDEDIYAAACSRCFAEHKKQQK